MASQPKGGGGATALLLFIAAAFILPAPQWDYHTLRFWGVSPEPPPGILEQEAIIAADKHNIDRRLFRALIKVESGWNPRALSHAGAIGLAQIMPSNYNRCGLKTSKQLWDVVHNTHCGAQILAEELETYNGDVVKALQAYNGGPRCVNRCRESIQYSAKVLANRNSLAG